MSALPRHLQRLTPTERIDHATGTLKAVVADTLAMLVDDLGLTRSELASRLGKSEAWVSRALSGSQNLTLKSISRIAHALGTKVEFRLRPEHRDGTVAENDPPLPNWVTDSHPVPLVQKVDFGAHEEVWAADDDVRMGQQWATT